MPALPSNSHRFLGRQTIFDERMRLYGYELLFRSGTDNDFSGDLEDATNRTIDSCLSIVTCSSCKNLFINCTREAIVGMSVKLLPSRTVVLEIPETVIADAEFIKACKQLKQYGFRIALDDFSPDKSKDELVDIADYVKVDFRGSDPAERQEIYKMFRKERPIFLAEKLETLEEVQVARAENNTLFQGYYHTRSEIVTETHISPGHAVYLQLLAALSVSPMDNKKVEHLLLMEPSLCYRLLRLANSPVYGFRHRILTIRAALSAVSEEAFRKLVTVALSSKLRQSLLEGDTERALERACFCESLAPILNENAAELYMLGMLSVMDRVLNIPMNRLVTLIAVAPRMEEALLGSTEGLGRALTLCKYEERGGSLQGLIHPDESVRDSSSYYFRALIAAAQNLRGLSARGGSLA